ncbi:hypothetical protein R75483_06880 [Paraburkholderia domus]|nr:hypothetical protein R75483_06880 [Paraburkholderia domus]
MDLKGIFRKKPRTLDDLRKVEAQLLSDMERSTEAENAAYDQALANAMSALVAGKPGKPDVSALTDESVERQMLSDMLKACRAEIAEREAEATLDDSKARWAAADDVRDEHVRRVQRLQAAIGELAQSYTDVLFGAEALFSSVPVKPNHRPHSFSEMAIRALVARCLFGATNGKFGEAAVSAFVASQDASLVERLRDDLVTLFQHRG